MHSATACRLATYLALKHNSTIVWGTYCRSRLAVGTGWCIFGTLHRSGCCTSCLGILAVSMMWFSTLRNPLWHLGRVIKIYIRASSQLCRVLG